MNTKTPIFKHGVRKAVIISIGTELVLGQSVDTNAAWLARELASIGARGSRHVTVDDDLAAIRDEIAAAAREADAVLITGGLGPTEDDMTRQALADAAGVDLALDEESLERIRKFFKSRHWVFPERNSVQAMTPRGGSALNNACGTAPGILMLVEGTPCFAMPGVPFEMKEMFGREVRPHLMAAAAGRTLMSRKVNCFGIGESKVGEAVVDLMRPGANPGVGTTAALGVIGVRINAEAESAEQAVAMLDATEAEVRRRLGPIVFGRDEDTLGGALGDLLRERGETVAAGESCTGGLIAKLLTDTPGSSEYFLGGAVTYSNALKQRLLGVSEATLAEHGAVSAATAEAMARGARERLGSTYGLSTTGVAGPDGGSPEKPVGLVYIGVSTPDGTQSQELRWGSDYPRDVIRQFSAYTAMNLLRLQLVEQKAGV